MRKEGFRGLYNSRDARVNIALFAAILVIFALTMVFVEAMTVVLRTPGNFTFNTTTNRNVNITFNATWFFGGGAVSPNENVSSCTLWINSTTNQIEWSEAKFVNITLNRTSTVQKDDALINGSDPNLFGLSYMNYTFTGDGNFTFAVGCFNATNSSAFAGNYNHTNVTWSSNFSVFVDVSPPVANFSASFRDLFNTSTVAAREIRFAINDSVYGISERAYGLNMSLNLSINLTIYSLGGQKIAFFSYVNDSSVTNLTCTATAPAITKGSVVCNATYTFNDNATFLINVSAIDAADSFRTASNFNTSAIRITVDQIPPVITQLNFSSNDTFADKVGSTTPSTVPSDGRAWAQGRRLLGFVNATDNLTAVIHGYLQFYNLTSSTWTTVNSTMNGGVNASPFGTNTNSTINLSYVIPSGHNVFEGVNISFRYLVNDTVGNVNTSGNVVNVTIQINDTTKPTLEVRVGSESGTLNFTNTTDTTPTVFWNITEGQSLRNISIQFASQTDQDCLGFKLFAATANANRNGSITLKGAEDLAGCTALSNGTTTIRLTAEDMWGNQELYIHSITVDTGGPNITFNNTQHGIAPVLNLTNVTPYIGINITVVGVGQAAVKNMTWTSSCNSSANVFTNGTFIYPFQNISSCANSQANRTVTIQAYDFVGNSQTKKFTFTVDDLGPSLAVNNPTNGFNGENNITINLSAQDGSQSVAQFGYFLDTGIISGVFVSLNVSQTSNGAAVNVTNSFKLNFTPGTHTIRFTANDTLGNAANSSIITFTALGPINFVSLGFNSSTGGGRNITLGKYNNLNFVNLSTIEGSPLENTRTITNANLSLLLALNHSPGKLFNVTFKFNGSAANWDKYNFSVTMNNSDQRNGIAVNQSAVVLNAIFFNDSVDEFLPDGGYYGIVQIPDVNLSNTFGGTLQIWYFASFNDTTSKVNVSDCGSSFTPSITSNSGMPCWNNTNNQTATVFVPHFSDIVLVNNTVAPTVNVTTPSPANQTIGMFVPNITVSSDAVSCLSSLNGSQANLTMAKSGTVCIGSTERFKNLNLPDGNYNFTFTVTDESGNINRYIWKFNVSDTTAPDNGIITSSPDVTTATVTITGTNETVNATVNYGTTNTSLGSSATQTDFNETQVVSISGLSASTTYHYNVTVCDFNGNCKTNASTFSFATSAAAAAAAAAASSSSGGGGGGAATPAPGVAAVAASTGTSWDTLAAGSSGTVAVKNDKIAVTSIVIDVKNTVTSPSVNVQSYTSNPLTTSAAAKVYQYLQLTKSNLADSDASKITISFKVPKSWLTSNGVAESDVVLWRYTSGNWNKLETKLVSSDGSVANYKAVTPGFSTFAIGNKEAGTSAFAIIDTIREFYEGTSKLTAFDIIDQIRSFYGG